MEGKVFRTRVSALYILFFGAFLYWGWFKGGLTGFVIFGIITVLCSLPFRSIYYVLTDKEILVYYMWGIMGKPFGRFYISVITSVERSYNPLNAPAASLKRLRFHFKEGYKWMRFFSSWMTGFPLISPVREQEFLEMLKTINPDIQINVTDKKGWWRFCDWDFNH